jgi:hypothetical protein
LDKRYEDDRPLRRAETGAVTGAYIGGAVAVLAALVTPLTGALAAVGLGVVAGALVGKAVAARISVDEWDPHPTESPHVGLQATDTDQD